MSSPGCSHSGPQAPSFSSWMAHKSYTHIMILFPLHLSTSYLAVMHKLKRFASLCQLSPAGIISAVEYFPCLVDPLGHISFSRDSKALCACILFFYYIRVARDCPGRQGPKFLPGHESIEVFSRRARSQIQSNASNSSVEVDKR